MPQRQDFRREMVARQDADLRPRYILVRMTCWSQAGGAPTVSATNAWLCLIL
jgi:hypothetical protein